MGSMSSLYIAMSGLHASQQSLHVTANNIANAATIGYTRQQAIHTSSQYMTLRETSTHKQQIGLGVDVDVVRQIRDRFLDKRMREASGRLAYYASQQRITSEVEDVFGEMHEEQFQNSIGDLWESMNEISKDPTTLENRRTFIENAATLLERAQLIQEQIDNYQVNINSQITEGVDRINEIGHEITALNKKITQVEMAGVERANDLRDVRNMLLDELGDLAKITYSEEKDRTVSVSIEGVPFVSGNSVNEMGVAKLTPGSDFLTPVWKFMGGKEEVFKLSPVPSVSSNSDLGHIKGLLLARGGFVADYTDMPVKPNQEDYLDASGDLLEDDYADAMDIYNEDVKKYNKEVNPSIMLTVQTEFDQFIHKLATYVNDMLSPNKTLIAGDGTEYKVLDTENAAYGLDGSQGVELFTRLGTSRYTEMEIDGETYLVYNEENPADYSTLYSVRNLTINPALLESSDSLCLSTGTGDHQSAVAKMMVDKWADSIGSLNCNELTPVNFDQYYASLVDDIGNRGFLLNSRVDDQESQVRSIGISRESVTGVSEEDELTNMMTFQHAYNAASKVINTMSEMLADIIGLV